MAQPNRTDRMAERHHSERDSQMGVHAKCCLRTGHDDIFRFDLFVIANEPRRQLHEAAVTAAGRLAISAGFEQHGLANGVTNHENGGVPRCSKRRRQRQKSGFDVAADCIAGPHGLGNMSYAWHSAVTLGAATSVYRSWRDRCSSNITADLTVAQDGGEVRSAP